MAFYRWMDVQGCDGGDDGVLQSLINGTYYEEGWNHSKLIYKRDRQVSGAPQEIPPRGACVTQVTRGPIEALGRADAEAAAQP